MLRVRKRACVFHTHVLRCIALRVCIRVFHNYTRLVAGVLPTTVSWHPSRTGWFAEQVVHQSPPMLFPTDHFSHQSASANQHLSARPTHMWSTMCDVCTFGTFFLCSVVFFSTYVNSVNSYRDGLLKYQYRIDYDALVRRKVLCVCLRPQMLDTSSDKKHYSKLKECYKMFNTIQLFTFIGSVNMSTDMKC